MAPNLSPGSFKIVSLIEGNPFASVNITKPAGQSVYLGGPVTKWVVSEENDGTYQLGVGGYNYTGVMDDKVTATIYAEQNTKWRATYHEHQDAYTIEPVHDKYKGWTAPTDSGDAAIGISPIIESRSIPPIYIPSQLFRFVPVDE